MDDSRLIACVGDSNMALGATALLHALHHGGSRCPVVFLAHRGRGIDGWERDLALLPPAGQYIVNLGVNDAVAGGYENWLERARAFRARLPGSVVWSNLPAELEPVPRQAGSRVVNDALGSLDVTVADWASVARPEWIDDAHLTADGARAWARCIVATLDARKPPARRRGAG